MIALTKLHMSQQTTVKYMYEEHTVSTMPAAVAQR